MHPSLSSPKPHPRLFLSREQIGTLKTQVETDPLSQQLFRNIRQFSDMVLTLPPHQRELEGRRLLAISRSVVQRVLYLSATALLTGDTRYAQRAISEMEAVAGFSDWNPSHFLDVGEMTLALAVGYDWLYEQLTTEQRDKIAMAIVEKGIKPSLTSEPYNWWINATNNWNQVCHAGLAAGALATAERVPALAARIVERALEKVPLAASAYAPDGAYEEGPNYWNYGTSFHVVLLALLESALGIDGGLADAPGFLASAHYIHQVTAPSERFFNYSDSVEQREFEVPLFWFARRLNNPGLLSFDVAALGAGTTERQASGHGVFGRLLPLALLWWQPEFSGRLADPVGLPLHWMAGGNVPVGIHRSAWNDPRGVYLALKGGCPAAPHGHMDGGAFVLEAGGVRWAADLGMQDYHSLEKFGLDLWNLEQSSDRWKILRLNSDGHNVLRFDGAPQRVHGAVPIVRFQAAGDLPHTVVDLSALYPDHATCTWRGVALQANGQILMQDEWMTGQTAVSVCWQMVTHAEVDLSAAPRKITLRQDEREFVLHVLEPTDAWIEVLDLSHPVHPYDMPNPGARMIRLHTSTTAGEPGCIRLAGALAGTEAAMAALPAKRPLAEW